MNFSLISINFITDDESKIKKEISIKQKITFVDFKFLELIVVLEQIHLYNFNNRLSSAAIVVEMVKQSTRSRQKPKKKITKLD